MSAWHSSGDSGRAAFIVPLWACLPTCNTAWVCPGESWRGQVGSGLGAEHPQHCQGFPGLPWALLTPSTRRTPHVLAQEAVPTAAHGAEGSVHSWPRYLVHPVIPASEVSPSAPGRQVSPSHPAKEGPRATKAASGQSPAERWQPLGLYVTACRRGWVRPQEALGQGQGYLPQCPRLGTGSTPLPER